MRIDIASRQVILALAGLLAVAAAAKTKGKQTNWSERSERFFFGHVELY